MVETVARAALSGPNASAAPLAIPNTSAAPPMALSFQSLSTTSRGQYELECYPGADTHPWTSPTGRCYVRLRRVCVALSGSWALVPTATVEHTHVQYHPHVQESEFVDPHSCLFENHRCLHLPQWSNQPHHVTERNAPSGPVVRSESALMRRGPAVIWVGTPKDTSFWEDRRDFLDFLNHDILGRRGGKGEVSTAPNPHTHSSRLAVINVIGCPCHRIPSNPDDFEFQPQNAQRTALFAI
jgi:hypothetical protein